MQSGGGSETYVYDAEHGRAKLTTVQGGTTSTTYFISPGGYEVTTKNGLTEAKHYVSFKGEAVAEIILRSGTLNGQAAREIRYLHHDTMGSTTQVSADSGAIAETLSYDAWGARRVATTGADCPPPPNNCAGIATDRGYTNHQHLDDVGLIHMNGRLYDPLLARMVSADPLVQAPGMSQSFNRYTYVMNSPLGLTDPTGYSWVGQKWKRELWGNTYGRAAMAIAASIYTAGAASGWVLGAYGATAGATGTAITMASGIGSLTVANVAAVTAGAAGGFVGGLVQSGGNAKAAGQSALTGAMFGLASAAGGINGSMSAERLAAHAAVGCLSGAMSGGGCGSGAAAAFAGKAITGLTESYWKDNNVAGFTIAAVAGGTASVVGGGKFSNGAYLGAMGFLFNQMALARGAAIGAAAGAASSPCLLCAASSQSSGYPEIDKIVGTSSSSSELNEERNRVWYHYTDRQGYEGIMESRAIRGNAARMVFATDRVLNAQEAETALFIGFGSHIGRGDYVIRFTAPGVNFIPFKSGEWFTVGTLRFDRHISVQYAGPNKGN